MLSFEWSSNCEDVCLLVFMLLPFLGRERMRRILSHGLNLTSVTCLYDAASWFRWIYVNAAGCQFFTDRYTLTHEQRSHTHLSILCFLNLMVPLPATFTHLRKISCASCGAARQLSFSLFVWHLLTTQTTSGFCANPRFCSLNYNRSIHDHLPIFISTVCFSCILNPN